MERSAPPAATTQVQVIADRLSHLFAQYRQAHGRKASDQQVADHIAQVTGKPCSRHWVRDLRNAAIRAPDVTKLHAIASFFGVAPGYLFDDPDTATTDDDVETARRVNVLFTRLPEPDGQPATNQQVADHVAEVTGQPCTAQWIADLRDAKIRAPDPARLDAITGFFGVARGYLYDATVAAAVEESIETGLALKKLEVHDIHLRDVAALSPDNLRAVAAVIRSLAAQSPHNLDH